MITAAEERERELEAHGFVQHMQRAADRAALLNRAAALLDDYAAIARPEHSGLARETAAQLRNSLK